MQNRKKKETLWFFWLRFRRAFASAYDSDFQFSPGHKRSSDSDYDSVASENKPLGDIAGEHTSHFPNLFRCY